MEQIINDYGKIAASISAIIALAILAWKTIKRLLDRRGKFQKEVLAKLDAIGDDVADLQCDRLNQAHDYYMDRGYCPTERKAVLCNMYKSYHAKGRNHLSEHYQEELLDLPDRPRK